MDAIVRPAIFAPLLTVAGLLVSAWFVNHGLPVPDEGAVLTLAARVMRGQIFYRHLDAYYFPGAIYLLAGWMSIFGEHVNAARWLAAVVFSGLLLGLYTTAVQLLDRRSAAVFGTGLLSLKLLAWPAFTAYFYSDLSLCFASFATALLVGHSYRGPSLRLVLAGAFVALAVASKQNLGIYLLLTAILLLALLPALVNASKLDYRQRLLEIGAFALGCTLIGGPMLGYFAREELLEKLITSGLLRPFLEYLPTSGLSFFVPLAWWNLGDLREGAAFPYSVGPYWSMLMNLRLPGESWYSAYWIAGELFVRTLYTSVVVAAFAVGWRWLRVLRRRQVSSREEKLLAFSALAFAIFLSAFPRADYFHVISVYPSIFLLLFGLAQRGGGDGVESEPSRRLPWRSACAVALSLLVTAGLTAIRHERQTYRMQIERADLYINPENSWVESAVAYADESLGPRDPLFVYGHEAYFYFLTGRSYNYWPFVQLYPGQVGGDRGVVLSRVLQRRPPKLIFRGVLAWPGVPGIESYAPAVNGFVMMNYEVVDEEMFESHPPPGGVRPETWSMQMLRRLRVPRKFGD